jgi:hypothetical protein
MYGVCDVNLIEWRGHYQQFGTYKHRRHPEGNCPSPAAFRSLTIHFRLHSFPLPLSSTAPSLRISVLNDWSKMDSFAIENERCYRYMHGSCSYLYGLVVNFEIFKARRFITCHLHCNCCLVDFYNIYNFYAQIIPLQCTLNAI